MGLAVMKRCLFSTSICKEEEEAHNNRYSVKVRARTMVVRSTWACGGGAFNSFPPLRPPPPRC